MPLIHTHNKEKEKEKEKNGTSLFLAKNARLVNYGFVSVLCSTGSFNSNVTFESPNKTRVTKAKFVVPH